MHSISFSKILGLTKRFMPDFKVENMGKGDVTPICCVYQSPILSINSQDDAFLCLICQNWIVETFIAIWTLECIDCHNWSLLLYYRNNVILNKIIIT